MCIAQQSTDDMHRFWLLHLKYYIIFCNWVLSGIYKEKALVGHFAKSRWQLKFSADMDGWRKGPLFMFDIDLGPDNISDKSWRN